MSWKCQWYQQNGTVDRSIIPKRMNAVTVVVVVIVIVVVVVDRTRPLVKHRLPWRLKYDIERGERRAREEGAAAVVKAVARRRC
ncbi:hypothetical protein QTP88_007635 [Uroleucon formosanum]